MTGEAPAQPDPLDVVPTSGVPPRAPQPWKFIGTSLWGLVIFAAMFAGQLAVVAYLVLRSGASFDTSMITTMLASGVTISLSVITGFPAVLIAIWIATRTARVPLADYLALRGTTWTNYLIGAASLIVLVAGWDMLSRAIGRDASPGFMLDVLRSARADGALWLLVIAFCVVAPLTEEFFARGFLYRGWSESFLRPSGAIVLSSMVWTAMHLQYDWFFFCEIFSIGLLLGYLRLRFNSLWLTVFVHGLNNLAATLQSLWMAGS